MAVEAEESGLPEWTAEVAGRAEALRKKLHLTQKELAAKCDDADSNYLSKVLRGERQPGGTLRRRMAEALGTSLEYLYSGVEPEPAHVVELDPELRGYPELQLLSASKEWRASSTPQAVRDYVLGLANSGGDQPLSEWIADFKQALKDHARGRPLTITRDALGREAEEDVVEDPDEARR